MDAASLCSCERLDFRDSLRVGDCGVCGQAPGEAILTYLSVVIGNVNTDNYCTVSVCECSSGHTYTPTEREREREREREVYGGNIHG